MVAGDGPLSPPVPPPPSGEGVMEWRVASLESDVRDIRATTVTQTEFTLRFSNLEGMVREIRDNLASSRNRTLTALILPTVSGAFVGALVILMNVLTSK